MIVYPFVKMQAGVETRPECVNVRCLFVIEYVAGYDILYYEYGRQIIKGTRLMLMDPVAKVAGTSTE